MSCLFVSTPHVKTDALVVLLEHSMNAVAAKNSVNATAGVFKIVELLGTGGYVSQLCESRPYLISTSTRDMSTEQLVLVSKELNM